MSAKALLAALFIAAPTIALADNHDTGDHVPYCGDEAAKRSPTCIPYNGDIPARADTGPWQACPAHLQQFPGMNCIVLSDDENIPGEALVKVSNAVFDEGEAVTVRVIQKPAEKPTCDTAYCSGPFTPYRDFIWHGPGHDDDQPGRRDVAGIDREPSREDTRSPMSSDNERDVQERADRHSRDRERQNNAMAPGD